MVAQVAPEATLLPIECHFSLDFCKIIVNVLEDLRLRLVESERELKLVQSVVDSFVRGSDLGHVSSVGVDLGNDRFHKLADRASGSRLHREQIKLSRGLVLTFGGRLAPS